MAARAWANGELDAGDRDGAAADLAAMGLTDDEASAIRAGLATDVVAVWPVNAPAVGAFLAAASQWRSHGERFVGLDYGGAAVAWRLHGLDLSPAEFAAVQVMEGAARDQLNRDWRG